MLFSRFAFTFFLPVGIFAAGIGNVTLQIDSIIQSSPAAQRGNIGFQFVDLQSGDILAELNSSKFFTPASNTKLYTTALALVRLGPNYKFETELRTSGPWSAGAASLSDLELIGGGDPNLSGRVLPYALHSVDMDRLAALKELASKLAAAGVREIDGDVTGVSTRYPGGRYPDGWTIDDAIYSYGAPVSALTLNDNAISLTVTPTSPGELAGVALEPSTGHLVILNEVTTDPSSNTQIQIARRPNSNEIKLSGVIGQNANPWREDVAVEDPALFAAQALIDVLEEQNITVRGVARSQYADGPTAPAGGTLLALHESVPLWEDLQVIQKVSQNLHAEMLLREVGHFSRGAGTLDAALAERDDFLQQIGISREGSGTALEDGSGLARQDLTTPQSTVNLLRYMWQHPEHDLWLRTLPIGGIDGSLERRFQNVAGAERVHAKTGFISHVNTLSGYIETDRHRWLAFSVMVNATASPESEIRTFIDRLCALFLNE